MTNERAQLFVQSCRDALEIAQGSEPSGAQVAKFIRIAVSCGADKVFLDRTFNMVRVDVGNPSGGRGW
jgi:hypothetical protein